MIKLNPEPNVKFSAYPSVTQSITTGIDTQVNCNAEEFDTANCYDSTTNYRFQPTVAGYYQISFQTRVQGATLTSAYSFIRDNTGTIVAYGTYLSSSSALDVISNGSKLLYFNGTTNYIFLGGYGSGTTLVVISGKASTFITGFLVS